MHAKDLFHRLTDKFGHHGATAPATPSSTPQTGSKTHSGTSTPLSKVPNGSSTQAHHRLPTPPTTPRGSHGQRPQGPAVTPAPPAAPTQTAAPTPGPAASNATATATQPTPPPPATAPPATATAPPAIVTPPPATVTALPVTASTLPPTATTFPVTATATAAAGLPATSTPVPNNPRSLAPSATAPAATPAKRQDSNIDKVKRVFSLKPSLRQQAAGQKELYEELFSTYNLSWDDLRKWLQDKWPGMGFDNEETVVPDNENDAYRFYVPAPLTIEDRREIKALKKKKKTP